MPGARDIVFLGIHTHTELLQYSPALQAFAPNSLLQSAQYVRYSRDNASVAWIGPRGSSLWRSRADGQQRLQLTPAGMEVYMVEWSPDGGRLVLMAREPGKLWRLYTVNADGGNLQPMLNENRNQADPSWLGNGDDMVFGRPPDLMAERSERKELYIFHGRSGTTESVPGSEGIFSPRSSPDGRYIAALTLGQRILTLFDRQTSQWQVAANRPLADPVWSHDGQWVYVHSFQEKSQPIYRLHVTDHRIERVASLGDLKAFDFADFRLVGLAPDDLPLIRTRMSTADLYLTSVRDPF